MKMLRKMPQPDKIFLKIWKTVFFLYMHCFVCNYGKGGYMSFPGGADSTESACNAGDWGLIPGLGRSSREEKG